MTKYLEYAYMYMCNRCQQVSGGVGAWGYRDMGVQGHDGTETWDIGTWGYRDMGYRDMGVQVEVTHCG